MPVWTGCNNWSIQTQTHLRCRFFLLEHRIPIMSWLVETFRCVTSTTPSPSRQTTSRRERRSGPLHGSFCTVLGYQKTFGCCESIQKLSEYTRCRHAGRLEAKVLCLKYTRNPIVNSRWKSIHVARASRTQYILPWRSPRGGIPNNWWRSAQNGNHGGDVMHLKVSILWAQSLAYWLIFLHSFWSKFRGINRAFYGGVVRQQWSRRSGKFFGSQLFLEVWFKSRLNCP